MKTVLVTGGSGFLASHAMVKLTKMGHKCISYSRTPPPVGVKLFSDNIEFVIGDTRDWGNLLGTIKKYSVDTILQTASLLMQAAQVSPPITFSIAAKGTLNLLEAARIFDIRRFVYMSGSSVYGGYRDETGKYRDIVTEDVPLTAWSGVYASTKLYCEHLLRNYSAEYGIEGTSIRPADFYGPGQSRRSLHFIKDLVEGALYDKFVYMPHEYDRRMNTGYVKDIATGVALACDVEPHKSNAYNLSCGIIPSPKLSEFVAAVKELIPEATYELWPPTDKFESVGPMSIDKAIKELGYNPKYSKPKDGIKDYIETLKNNPVLRKLDRYAGLAYEWCDRVK
jgi:nucleoside-diphosphate-sugar epimerase